MTFIAFIIYLSTHPKETADFMAALSKVSTKKDLKTLFDKYKVKVTKSELDVIFDNKDEIVKFKEGVQTPKY
jgi:hypothetical protein